MDSGLGPLHMFSGHNCKTVRKHESGKRKEHGAIGYCVETNTSNSCGRTRSHARAPLISSQVQQCRIRISNPDLTISSPHSCHPHSSVAAMLVAMVLDPLIVAQYKSNEFPWLATLGTVELALVTSVPS